MDSRMEQLQALIEEGNKFTVDNFCFPSDDGTAYCGPDKPEWLTWKTRSFNLIKAISSDNSPAVKLATTGISVETDGYYEEDFNRAKGTIMGALEITFESMKLDTYGELRAPISNSKSPSLSNRVFIVHGHDESLKNDFERFIHEIGLEPVVLHRQPDQGLTIIEKFEKNSDVGYAFILLTPDEIAYTIDQNAIDDDKRKKEKRVRPNVIFEFGYFVGYLGRNRVCCIYKEGVELPTDVTGLVYKKVQGSIETIALSIIKELKAAGYQIKV